MEQNIAHVLDTHFNASILATEFSDDQYDDVFDDIDARVESSDFCADIDAWVRRSLTADRIGDL